MKTMQDVYTLKSVTNPDGRPKVNPVAKKYIGKKCRIELLVPGRRATLSFKHWENGGNVEP